QFSRVRVLLESLRGTHLSKFIVDSSATDSDFGIGEQGALYIRTASGMLMLDPSNDEEFDFSDNVQYFKFDLSRAENPASHGKPERRSLLATAKAWFLAFRGFFFVVPMAIGIGMLLSNSAANAAQQGSDSKSTMVYIVAASFIGFGALMRRFIGARTTVERPIQ